MICDPRQDGWQGCPVLVTGGLGFVGANLVRALLARGARVHVLGRAGSSPGRLADCLGSLRLHTADVGNPDAVAAVLAAVRPAVIFHLATARGMTTEPAQYLRTTVLGASHLMNGLRRGHAGRLVVAGSSLEYAPCDGPIAEHHPLVPATYHGAVKAVASLLYQQAARAEGLAITQLRLFHVYGPWESTHRFLPTAIRLALAGQPVPLASGVSRRDWVHVDDVVAALLLAGQATAPADIFNIGSGLDHDNEAVIDVLAATLQRPIATRADALPARPTDSAQRRADIGAARQRLGWVPRHDLARGIAAATAWFLANRAWLDEGPGAPPVVY